jgi:hypothetical protein
MPPGLGRGAFFVGRKRPGCPGPPGVVDYSHVLDITAHTHEQAQATTVWAIQHDLGFYPSVAAVTYGGNHVIGEVKYIAEGRCDIIESTGPLAPLIEESQRGCLENFGFASDVFTRRLIFSATMMARDSPHT